MVYDSYKHHPRQYDSADQQLATRFAQILHKEFSSMILDVIFFGSATKSTATQMYGADIDVLVLVDDRVRTLSTEATEAYRIIVKKAAERTSLRLHINTLKLSTFLEHVLNGDPLSTNILRDGIPLLEAGFVESLQNLQSKGYVHASNEVIWNYMIKAPQAIVGAKFHVLQATIDLYWAAIDATHALLQKMGHVPYSPDQAIHLLSTEVVRHKRVDAKTASILRELYDTEKRIASRDIKEVTGKQYQLLYGRTKEYVNALNQLSGGMRFGATHGETALPPPPAFS